MIELPKEEVLCNNAIALFRDEFNCAQSVLSVYSEHFHIDKVTAQNISRGFGAGMGQLQETCGAVTAAYMVFGLVNSSSKSDNQENISVTKAMIQKFHNGFTKSRGTTLCKELLKCDLKTEEGQDYFKTHNLKENVCEACIRDAIRLINAIVTDHTNP